MKRIYLSIGLGAIASTIRADGISDGLSMAGDATYSYLPYVQVLCYVITCVIGLMAAYEVYYAIASNSPYIKKKILVWGGSCLTMLCMTIALPQFFDYQEGGLIAENTTGSFAYGNYRGGNSYGQLDTSIPPITDSRWEKDGSYIPINVGGWETNVNTFLNTLYDQVGAGAEGSYGKTLNYIENAFASGEIDRYTYDQLKSYSGNLPHN